MFALYLRLLYLRSGRRYGEHMLFDLHANAFAFLLLGVMRWLVLMAFYVCTAAAVMFGTVFAGTIMI